MADNKFGLPGSRTEDMDVRVDIRLLVSPLISSNFEKELRDLFIKYHVKLLEIDDGYFMSTIEKYRHLIDEEEDNG